MAHERLQHPPRSLVIGGGLLGSHVAARLAASGHPTVLASRSLSPWLADQPSIARAIDLVEIDIRSAAQLEPLVSDAEVVYLMAGSSTPVGADHDPSTAARSTVMLALQTLDVTRRHEVRRVVLASSGGTIYGRTTHLPTPEDHPTEPISLHGVNALAIETYCAYFARQHALEPVVLRVANAYGPGQRVRADQGVLAAWCEAFASAGAATLIGSGKTRRDFVYAADAADAAVRAAVGAPAGTYNVGGGGSCTMEDLLELLVRVTGREQRVRRVPGREVDVPATELDISRLRQATGWTPMTRLEDGVAAMWSWVTSTSSVA